MAKIVGPARSTAASGTLGNQIFSRNRYGFYSYEKPAYGGSSSEQQLAMRDAFLYCSDFWNNNPLLTKPLRDAWENFGTIYPQKDRFGREYYAKARQWFLSVNIFKRLAGFNLKIDPPIHASCAFYPTVEFGQSADGIIATPSLALEGESLFYCSVVAAQSLNRNFIPKIASYGTLWKLTDTPPFLIYPNAGLPVDYSRNFIRYKFIDYRGIQSPYENTFSDIARFYLPATLSITEDTFIYSATPNTNWGDGTDFHCWNYGGELINSLVRNPMTNVTKGFLPVSATLHLYCKSVVAAGPCQTFQCLTEWEEMQATYNIRKLGTNWGVAGGQTGIDFLIDPSDTVTVDTAEQWYEFDVTSIVSSWQYPFLPNYGIFLRPTSSDVKVSFHSSNYPTDPLKRPFLTFVWE
jgi:hypothetical protein